MNRLRFEGSQFYLNNQPFRILSGTIHYFRVVPDYWEDRLLKLKQCGFNTVETYTCWNLHEPREGEFDFSGILDLARFLETASRLGLYVILRPGPYICAEWDMGGLPSWLLTYPHIHLRCHDELFLSKVRRYYKKLFSVIRPYLGCNGGCIIAMQVENEYGSYGDDHTYMQDILSIYEEENLDAYRKYVFGNVDGKLISSAAVEYTTDEIYEKIKNIEKDPFYIYINGSNPNREELTFKNKQNQIQTVKRNMIQFNNSGTNAVIATSYMHSVVEGRGKGKRKGNLLLIADTRGKMMISYLSEIFEKVYVSNIYGDADLIQNLDEILEKYNIEYVIWAQDVAETGNRSYMKALNPLLKEGGVSDVGTDP